MRQGDFIIYEIMQYVIKMLHNVGKVVDHSKNGIRKTDYLEKNINGTNLQQDTKKN